MKNQVSANDIITNAIELARRVDPSFSLRTYARATGEVAPEDGAPRLLSGTAARRYLGGISTMTLWRWCRAGLVTPVRVNKGRPMYDRTDLDELVNRAKGR